MPTKIDLIGRRFERLLVVGQHASIRRRTMWSCICDCGNTRIINGESLRSGATKSCGCLHREVVINQNTIHGYSISGSQKGEYTAWANMKDRCYNEKNGKYHNYGGRGIRVCDRWIESFSNFIEDVGDKPSKEYSLDRINTNGNYQPDNCRWATFYQQSRNRNNNIWLTYTYNGITAVESDWQQLMGTAHGDISKLMKSGMTFDEIVELYNDELPPTI